MKTILLTSAAVFAMVATFQTAYAQDNPEGGRAQMKERLAAACSGKSANDPCSFTRRDGQSEDGTCTNVKDQLLCVSERMKNRMSRAHSGSGGLMRGLMHGM